MLARRLLLPRLLLSRLRHPRWEIGLLAYRILRATRAVVHSHVLLQRLDLRGLHLSGLQRLLLLGLLLLHLRRLLLCASRLGPRLVQRLLLHLLRLLGLLLLQKRLVERFELLEVLLELALLCEACL